MGASVRVDLHCHSSCSDGALPPEGVAHRLAAAGVRCAALTDHDTAEGTTRFAQALEQRGILALAGIELALPHPLGELHFVALGFRPEVLCPSNPALPRLGRALRSAWSARGGAGETPSSGTGPAAALFRRVHDAGGRIYLAHPLLPISDVVLLERTLPELKAAGLDGLEALYKPYTREVRSQLARLAMQHGLLVVAGSDFHGDGVNGSAEPGCDMPSWHWERFCLAHGLPGASGTGTNDAPPGAAGPEPPRSPGARADGPGLPGRTQTMPPTGGGEE